MLPVREEGRRREGARLMALPNLSVGWYGFRDDERSRSTLVHVHVAGEGPLCGARLSPRMEFQWCSNTNTQYVECMRCLRSLDAPRRVTLREQIGGVR